MAVRERRHWYKLLPHFWLTSNHLPSQLHQKFHEVRQKLCCSTSTNYTCPFPMGLSACTNQKLSQTTFTTFLCLWQPILLAYWEELLYPSTVLELLYPSFLRTGRIHLSEVGIVLQHLCQLCWKQNIQPRYNDKSQCSKPNIEQLNEEVSCYSQ